MLALVVLTVLLCYDSPNFSYKIEPAWYVDQRERDFTNAARTLPVVTDLDGDNNNELIVITPDFSLTVSLITLR